MDDEDFRLAVLIRTQQKSRILQRVSMYMLEHRTRKSDFTWLTADIFGAYWQHSEWEEVLLLLIAMLHDQGTPIREVVEYLRAESWTPVPLNVAFAARCLGEAGDLQNSAHAQDLLAELASTLMEYARQSWKPEARAFVEAGLRAFATLAPMVPQLPPVVQEVIDRLSQANTVAARMAAWQMGFALRSRKERLDFALAALNDEEEAVRRGVVAALERAWPGRHRPAARCPCTGRSPAARASDSLGRHAALLA